MGFPVTVCTVVLPSRVFKLEAELVWAGLQGFKTLVKERFLTCCICIGTAERVNDFETVAFGL